jgi:hypothetical protein
MGVDINNRADAAIAGQVNVNPIVNISVMDLERQWDTTIAPRSKRYCNQNL